MSARPEIATVRIEDFRRVVGAAPGELEGLLKSGAIRRAAPGRLPLIEAVRSFISYVRASARDASAASAMADAKAARAESAELSIAIEDRTLIRDEQADAALVFICGSILETLASIPARVSRDRLDRAQIEDALRAAQEAVVADVEALAVAPSLPSSPTPTRPSRAQSKGSTP